MSKQKRPVVNTTRVLQDAMFAYFSTCCNELAKKPPCVKTEDAEGTLGSWRCGKCNKPCSVQRTKKVREDKVEVTVG